MRLVVKNYDNCTIYSERPFGYKRFVVEWYDHTEVFSGLWYNEIDVVERIDKYNKDTLPYRVDNAKELARELKNESKFITKVQ